MPLSDCKGTFLDVGRRQVIAFFFNEIGFHLFFPSVFVRIIEWNDVVPNLCKCFYVACVIKRLKNAGNGGTTYVRISVLYPRRNYCGGEGSSSRKGSFTSVGRAPCSH